MAKTELKAIVIITNEGFTLYKKIFGVTEQDQEKIISSLISNMPPGYLFPSPVDLIPKEKGEKMIIESGDNKTG